MTALPAQFAYLLAADMPQITKEAVKLYGTLEVPGPGNNPTILKWADEIGDKDGSAYAKWAAGFYNADSIPWCGLFAKICAVRSNPDNLANRRGPDKYLSALEWINFGEPAGINDMIVGDIAVMKRAGGGHVTQIVGISPDHETFYGIGGNQGDKVSIAPFPVDRLRGPGCGVRRIPYKVRPAGARQIVVTSRGMSAVRED